MLAAKDVQIRWIHSIWDIKARCRSSVLYSRKKHHSIILKSGKFHTANHRCVTCLHDQDLCTMCPTTHEIKIQSQRDSKRAAEETEIQSSLVQLVIEFEYSRWRGILNGFWNKRFMHITYWAYICFSTWRMSSWEWRDRQSEKRDKAYISFQIYNKGLCFHQVHPRLHTTTTCSELSHVSM